ncbi:alpha/beta fold hydrolase [Streptomyces sp. NRRL B-24484]|uniref:alpha/beta fold hydrolase n=1 Tax=Streptomyces sp. NRRL B-24484 TaxID=1463833 RepID=UPI0004C0F9CC|nr:alpha/beta hydrolase [Streptomyces sp. NRRL B-24484]
MGTEWQLRESGPAHAPSTVLLLPGGMCSAGSYAEVMAQPVLGQVRLVAATLPGHAGTVPLRDCSIESYARVTAELAAQVRADVVVGFSIGACVAAEMVTSGAFSGPVVLLGISLSSADEPAFFHAIVGLGRVLGGLPATFLAKGAASMLKRKPLTPERRAELQADLERNDPAGMRLILLDYARWLRRSDRRAARLGQTGVPAWIVHAEKGDGGLTAAERSTLEACANVRLVTIPGSVFLLPVEAPGPVTAVIGEAVAHATRSA